MTRDIISKLSWKGKGRGGEEEGAKLSFDLVCHNWDAIDTVLFPHMFFKLSKAVNNDKYASLWECCNSKVLVNIIDSY